MRVGRESQSSAPTTCINFASKLDPDHFHRECKRMRLTGIHQSPENIEEFSELAGEDAPPESTHSIAAPFFGANAMAGASPAAENEQVEAAPLEAPPIEAANEVVKSSEAVEEVTGTRPIDKSLAEQSLAVRNLARTEKAAG
jgi:hypothetical protein